jgi:hypothetical protein
MCTNASLAGITTAATATAQIGTLIPNGRLQKLIENSVAAD